MCSVLQAEQAVRVTIIIALAMDTILGLRGQWAVLFLIPYYLLSLGYIAAFLLAGSRVIGSPRGPLIPIDASLYPWPLNCPLTLPERDGFIPLPGPMTFGYRPLTPVEEVLYAYGFVIPMLPAVIIIAPLLLQKSTSLLQRKLRLQSPGKELISTGTGKALIILLLLPAQSIVTYLSYDFLRTVSLIGIYSLQTAIVVPSFLLASFSSFAGTILLLAGRRVLLSSALIASPWIVAGTALFFELMRYSVTCSST